jgi:5-methylcytosine-specific restriction endonuclease McrA
MHKVDEPPLCWICGSIADSAEHRLKKADLVRAYGKGPYDGPSAPVHVVSGEQRSPQGPGSRILKYRKSLCARCNSAKTQPFDRAYDQLIDWLNQHEQDVLQKRQIDFAEVYGDGFAESQRSLFKYFVKSFGCRLFDAGQQVPPDLVELLALEQFRTKLSLTLCVNEDVLLLPKSTRWGYLAKGDLMVHSSRSNPTAPPGFTWHEAIAWFRVNYWYGQLPQGGTGSTWVADAQYVYLGSISPLHPEVREATAARVAALRDGDG